MVIREANADDADLGMLVLRRSIEQLCVGDHSNDPHVINGWLSNKTVDSWKQWLKQENTSLFVAERESLIVGVGMVDHSGTILLNYVTPEARWQGVSKALLRHMEGALRSRGVSVVSLESTMTAREFYRSAGYSMKTPDPLSGQMFRTLSR